jgi:uncharacterized membrane protein YdjX (TVP38/TMEM64 family)
MAEAATHIDESSREVGRRSPAIKRHWRRVAPWIRWLSIGVIIVSMMLIARALPAASGIQWLTDWVKGLGMWGPIVFAIIYVVAALLLVPAWPFTLVAGAVFGLLWGAVLASIAATTTAGLAFLIARYLARARVERFAQRHRTFAAIDKAVELGGWKIIALLRLSPAVPFSIGNYLYGLTPVRFCPYLTASWVAMLPGTFLYVYLGYVGGAAVGATGSAAPGPPGAGGEKNPWQWALLGAGLVATIVVSVYITILAVKALKRLPESKELAGGAKRDDGPARPKALWPIATVAVIMAVLAAGAHLNKARLSNLFSPPAVTLTEAYADKSAPGGPVFDHFRFDALLRKHVTEDGFVDYAALKKEPAELDAYIASIGSAKIDDLGRDERLALLINAYNAFTLKLILDHYPLKSIKDIPDNQRWDGRKWQIGPHSWTLNEIEHQQIRPKFKEPRIHFALVCAAKGCPILRTEAYQADRLDEQLEAQTKYVHSPPGGERWFQFDSQRNVVRLTPLYDWYGGDFKQVAGSVLGFAAQYSPELKAALDARKEPKIEWLDYDWTLNDSGSKESVP